MSLIKKPSELEMKHTLTALIYGSPGVGKSSLACSAPNAVLFDFDNGVTRVNGAHRIDTVQVRSWEETLEALDEVKATPFYQTIIIDTVGKMMFFMEEYIKRTNPKMKQFDGSLSLKGFGQRKQMFLDFIKNCSAMGRNVIFVAHDIEQKRGDETIIRPEIGGSSGNDLTKELDLVGYMEMYGNKRTISFTPCEKYIAKNTCNMPGIIEVPVLIDDKGALVSENNFMSRVLAAYTLRQEESKAMTAKFEQLRDQITTNVAEIKDAESANKFVSWLQSVEQVYNSKALARKLFQAKVEELGLTYDTENKAYVAA